MFERFDKCRFCYSENADLKFSIEVSGAQQLRKARINEEPFSDSLKVGESLF
jgi:hypothetical protein